MAKYNKINDPVRKAKEFNNIAYNRELGHENTLKSFNTMREKNRLYEEGMKLGMVGGDIESATELVEENGIMIPKYEHRNFKIGYKRGLEQFKNNLFEKIGQNNEKTR